MRRHKPYEPSGEGRGTHSDRGGKRDHSGGQPALPEEQPEEPPEQQQGHEQLSRPGERRIADSPSHTDRPLPLAVLSPRPHELPYEIRPS
ncbi:hypothetical protein J7I97_06935 [Streptomyces sp. ISL-87]|nr:hypothetical protein [Streptomyces sp. ISL-21]MBT2608033.1 hypothetical protein [Streptomyces sp. ISL-87]